MQDKDKYIPGEEREDPPIGLYKIVKMDGGAPKIKFDDPFGEGKKPEEPQPEEAQPAEAASCGGKRDRVSQGGARCAGTDDTGCHKSALGGHGR